MLIIPILAPWGVSSAHPATVEVDVVVFAVEEGIGQVGLFPGACGVGVCIDLLFEVGQDGATIAEVYAGEALFVNVAIEFYGFACPGAAQDVIDVHISLTLSQ